MSILQAIVLSLVQGITEFLPISSSGHLILCPKFFGWPDQGLAFDAIVHLGTAAAVIVYYRKKIIDLIVGALKKQPKELKITGWILLSMIPAVLVGVTLKEFISTSARSVEVVAFSLMAWGIILIIAERYAQSIKEKISFDQIGWKRSAMIGLAQAFALIPGTSRSGITLTAAYFLNISRLDAVAFSFLMGVPVILGAGGLSFIDLLQTSGGNIDYLPLLIALIGSFVSGLFAIHIVRVVVSKNGLYFFGVYRIALALLLMLLFF